jgi:hypothetical protein
MRWLTAVASQRGSQSNMHVTRTGQSFTDRTFSSKLDMYLVLELGCLIALTGIVTAILRKIIRSRPLAILGSVTITELLILIHQYYTMGESKNQYAAEAYLYPMVLLVVTAPIVGVVSTCFTFLVDRFRRRRAGNVAQHPRREDHKWPAP